MTSIFTSRRRYRRGWHLAAVFGLALAGALPAVAQAPVEVDMWPGIAKDLYGAKPIAAEDGSVVLEAPVRAEDAALVPLTIRMPSGTAVKTLTLVVEKNPAPVVASFTFGPAAGTGERKISTRIRVDMYSNIRAIIETTDGALHMTTKFVKAAGGCSAPALKDADEALASIGKTQLKLLGTEDGAGLREAQFMIRHPNYSGMQMNQATGLYIPAKFVDGIEVKRGPDLVFKLEGGISISENPNIVFTYDPGHGEPLEVVAKDTDGRVFTARSIAKGS